jgi:succinoglycan biosynthesis protein ExoO
MEVSVIIAAHNVEKFVGRAIDSVIAQTFRDWEIIVVDDASTDGTARTVEDTGREDPRIRLLRHERNAGPAAARNTGLSAANGKWIAILDADDAWRPDRLQRMLALAEATGVDFVADNQILYDDALQREVGIARRIPGEWIPLTAEKLFESDETMRLGEMKPLIRHTFIVENGLRYDAGLRFGEDLYFYAELLIRGARAILMAEPLYLYTTPLGFVSGRKSGGSRTVKRFDILVRGADDLLKKHRGSLPPELLEAIRAYRTRRHNQWATRELTRLRNERRLVSLIAFTMSHPAQAIRYIATSRTFRAIVKPFPR